MLDTEIRVLGAEHVNVLDARYELAQAISAQGRHQEAEQELQEVISGENRVLGPEHHLLGHARFALGETLASQGKLEEAMTELRALLDTQTRTLGPANPRTTLTRETLAAIEITST